MNIINYIKNKKYKIIGIINHTYLVKKKKIKQNTASTKSKGKVRGGGKKPWKQKGTGRARAGSLRSPLFVGGGIIFGPKFKKIIFKINKIEQHLSFVFTIYLTKYKNIIFYIKNLSILIIIKLISKLFKYIKVKTLIIIPYYNYFIFLKTRNFKNIKLITFKKTYILDYISTKCILYIIKYN